jgi:predicted RNA-binding protein YlxR (DUF448 family)
VVCRGKRPQRDLVRVTRSDEGVVVGAGVRGPGRGAYVCRRAACWDAPHRGRALEAALKMRLGPEDVAALERWRAEHAAELEENATLGDGPDAVDDEGDTVEIGSDI